MKPKTKHGEGQPAGGGRTLRWICMSASVRSPPVAYQPTTSCCGKVCLSAGGGNQGGHAAKVLNIAVQGLLPKSCCGKTCHPGGTGLLSRAPARRGVRCHAQLLSCSALHSTALSVGSGMLTPATEQIGTTLQKPASPAPLPLTLLHLLLQKGLVNFSLAASSLQAHLERVGDVHSAPRLAAQEAAEHAHRRPRRRAGIGAGARVVV